MNVCPLPEGVSNSLSPSFSGTLSSPGQHHKNKNQAEQFAVGSCGMRMFWEVL